MTKSFDMVLEETIADRYEIDEHNISNEQNLDELSSHECVKDWSRQSSMLWASVRNAHNRSKI